MEVNLFTKEEMQKREMQVKHQCEAVSQIWIVGYSAGKKKIVSFFNKPMTWRGKMSWGRGVECFFLLL